MWDLEMDARRKKAEQNVWNRDWKFALDIDMFDERNERNVSDSIGEMGSRF